MSAKEVVVKLIEIVAVPILISVISIVATLWVAKETLLIDKANEATYNRFKALLDLNVHMHEKGQAHKIYASVGVPEAKLQEFSEKEGIDADRIFYDFQSLIIYAMYNQTVRQFERRRTDSFSSGSHYYNMIKTPGFNCVWQVIQPFFGGTNTEKRVIATRKVHEEERRKTTPEISPAKSSCDPSPAGGVASAGAASPPK